MEVVRQNFKETLPQISAAIKKADFLVIDAEFTGLMNGRDVSIFDLPSDYYKCLLNGATEFLIIQFGLCAFYWDEEKKHYMNDAYNFYLFPRGKPGPEKIFMCQSSSLDFLISQGFDFNKMIRDGISYMTEPAETKLREQLKERQKSVKEKDIIPIPEEHRNIIEETCKKVRRFLDDDDKTDEMLIDRCNAFQRLLLYQELKIRFKEEIMLETHIQENKNRVLKVLRMKSQNDERNHTNQKKEKEWEDLEDNVGFSKVARMISQSEKLVIGHNMVLDVLHTLNNFFHPLPDDYCSFKEFAHCMFPNLLDTKYMSSLPPFKDKVNSSVLHHLLSTLSEPPFSLPKVGSYEGRGYKKADEKHHEAGFDAYITGLCFLSMHSHLSRMRGEEYARALPASPVLKPFLNKLFLAKTAHQDSPYMNLTGAEPTPSREHVFHLTFPKEWTRNDINLLFSPYGPIVCQFLDETRAIVALTRRENARVVTRGIASNLRVKLVPYNFYKAKTEPRLEQKPPPDDKSARLIYAITNIPQAKSHAANSASASTSSVPEKMQRVTTAVNNVTAVTSPPVVQTRKRTSSGVFQVDETEPPPKKTEHTRSNSDGALQKLKSVKNGRRKVTETSGSWEETKERKDKIITEREGKKEKNKLIERERKKDRIIKVFDSEAKSQCVSAFKESDSWG